VLRRGYSIATRVDGRAIRRSTDVLPGESIAVRLSTGSLEATVERALEDSKS
jgi:exonuclease VII large subunit